MSTTQVCTCLDSHSIQLHQAAPIDTPAAALEQSYTQQLFQKARNCAISGNMEPMVVREEPRVASSSLNLDGHPYIAAAAGALLVSSQENAWISSRSVRPLRLSPFPLVSGEKCQSPARLSGACPGNLGRLNHFWHPTMQAKSPRATKHQCLLTRHNPSELRAVGKVCAKRSDWGVRLYSFCSVLGQDVVPQMVPAYLISSHHITTHRLQHPAPSES